MKRTPSSAVSSAVCLAALPLMLSGILGAVWLAIYKVPERVQAVRDLLGVPEPMIPFALMAVGVPDETGNLMERYLPERVHRNRW